MATLRLARDHAHEPNEPTPPTGGAALPHPTTVVPMTEHLARRLAWAHVEAHPAAHGLAVAA
jgi:hypothetical protein